VFQRTVLVDAAEGTVAPDREVSNADFETSASR